MNVDLLLHPEELSNGELVSILNSLNVSVSSDDPRFYLLSIYRRVALPLPQREIKAKNRDDNSLNPPRLIHHAKSDVLTNLKREQISVVQIVDHTKKMKLNDIEHNNSSIEEAEELSDKCVLQESNNVDSRRENLKRRFSLHHDPECRKRTRFVPLV